jgi:hypothetical protein
MSRKSPHPPPSTELFDDEATEFGPPGDDDGLAPEDVDYDDLEFPPEDDERTIPGVPLDLDTFEDSSVHHRQVVLDPGNASGTGRFRNPNPLAPLPSQGAWRERGFSPRGVVPREQVATSLDEALQIAAMQRGPLEKVRAALRAELVPLILQVMEQAGGDGLDAWLSRLVMPPGRPAKDPLLAQLTTHMLRFGAASHKEALLAEAGALCATAKKALFSPGARRISLKVLEDEFEGKLEVATLLSIAFCSDTELAQRVTDVERSLDSMRAQLRGFGGGSPTGLMWNFSRMKIEKRLAEAEQKRRGPPRG